MIAAPAPKPRRHDWSEDRCTRCGLYRRVRAADISYRVRYARTPEGPWTEAVPAPRCES